jgi:hypothetical protein
MGLLWAVVLLATMMMMLLLQVLVLVLVLVVFLQFLQTSLLY